jgi:hypothetical protein
MENRRQFLKKTAAIAAAELGKMAVGVGAMSTAASETSGESVSDENVALLTTESQPEDIRKLSQHFTSANGDILPWMFIPADNIKEISTTEHPGLVTVRQAGRGKDVRGILENPIAIDDYDLPWEFQMSLVQNYMAALLGTGDSNQDNCAIGFNVALTFSDPALWPKDRTQRPPDTHDFQLFVVHLGSTGEFSPGLPQFVHYRSPETYLVWGRGDLDASLNGDWKIPYFLQGSMPDGGPASPQIFFRFQLQDPSRLQVGIKFKDWNEYYMRSVDCSRFGKITGVWEIGPIFSCDRWIPDVLCKQIPVLHPEIINPPEPIAPNPLFEFYVDYCAFLDCSPTAPWEHFSDEFDRPGFLTWRGFQIPFQAETWSHPGYLTITLLGASQGCYFFPMTLTGIDLKAYPPPWEWEVCVIPPAEPAPWNLYFTHRFLDTRDTLKAFWRPGVIYDPRTKRTTFTNSPFRDPPNQAVAGEYLRRSGYPNMAANGFRSNLTMVFDPEPPQEIMSARPLYMLYQLLDTRHLRMGFKGSANGPWHMSKILDVSDILEGDIGKIDETCLGIVSGRHFQQPPGAPMYAQYRFDYIRFRRGLSK